MASVSQMFVQVGVVVVEEVLADLGVMLVQDRETRDKSWYRST